MPVVFRTDGYRFHFFSDEGAPREPVHIHVTKGNADAKFWLYPDVNVAYNRGFNSRDQNALSKIIELHRQEIEDAWHDHFS
jgi:Domain of unknown function (DUF4160)